MTRVGVQFLCDPYVFGAPIKDPSGFFGRREQLQQVAERLGKRESTSLVGEHRSGKTSMLYYLTTATALRELGFDTDQYAFVYVDPQLGIREPKEFYRELVDGLEGKTTALATGRRREVTRRQVRAALKQLEPRRAVILLDEFEHLIGNEQFPIDFFEFLRGLAGYHEVRFVTATMKPLPECYWGQWEGSPLYNIFPPPEWLGSWNPAELEQFLEETSRRSGAPMVGLQGHVSQLAGRFPFYVQMACSFYLDVWRRRGEITEDDHAAVRQSFSEAASVHFERVWRKYLPPEEKGALRALAQGGQPHNATHLTRLAQKGYVVDSHLFSSALGDFVLCQEANQVRVSGPEAQQSGRADLWLDRRTGEVWVKGKKCAPPLTNLTYKLLLCLYDNADCICDKNEVVQSVWGGGYMRDVDDQRLAKLVSRLRQRIEQNPASPEHVITVHGRGYVLQKAQPRGEDSDEIDASRRPDGAMVSRDADSECR